MSSGGRRTSNELETDTVRRVYVLFEVQSTASSDGRPLIVNLESATSVPAAYPTDWPPSTAFRISAGSSSSW